MQPDKDAMSSMIGTDVLAKSVLAVLAEMTHCKIAA